LDGVIIGNINYPKEGESDPMLSLLLGNIRISMNISLIKVQLMKSSFMNVPCPRQKLRKT